MFSAVVVILVLCLSLPNSQAADNCLCGANGDPHYQTFDGASFGFMGKCKYILTETIKPINDCSVTVNAINAERAPNLLPYTKAVEIKFMNYAFRLEQGNRLFVNGKEIQSRAVTASENVQVMLVGNWLTFVSRKCGIRVEFDGLWNNVYVKLRKSLYAGKVQGLCGDCDGTDNNDFRARGTSKTVTAGEFAQSYQTYGEVSLPAECQQNQLPPTLKPAPCRGEWGKRVLETKYCGAFMIETSSPFKKCISANRAAGKLLYEACVYDVCINSDNLQRVQGIVCGALGNLALACSEQGFSGIDWRNQFACEQQCPGKMVYMSRVEPCPDSCDSRRADSMCPVDLPYKEGCACPSGFVQFGTNCVTPDKCPPNKEVTLTFTTSTTNKGHKDSKTHKNVDPHDSIGSASEVMKIFQRG